MFIDLKGRELLEKNLYRNFVMHMCNLSDYGLVSPDVQYKTIHKLQRLLSSSESGRKSVATGRSVQLDHWMKVGLAKQKQKQQDELTKKNVAAASLASSTSPKVPRLTPQRNDPELRSSLPRTSTSGAASKEDVATKRQEKMIALGKGRENKPNKNVAQPVAASLLASNNNNKRRFSNLRGLLLLSCIFKMISLSYHLTISQNLRPVDEVQAPRCYSSNRTPPSVLKPSQPQPTQLPPATTTHHSHLAYQNVEDPSPRLVAAAAPVRRRVRQWYRENVCHSN